jgi:hypothetical protein
MKFSKLMSLPELHDHYKEYSEKTFADDSGVLEDAFTHGPFHEEEFRFDLLATRLSDSELASLFLPIAHALVRGTPAGHIDEVRELYQALDEWQAERQAEAYRLSCQGSLIGSGSVARMGVVGNSILPRSGAWNK